MKRAFAAALVALTLFAACGGSDDHKVATRKRSTTTRRTTTSASVTTGSTATTGAVGGGVGATTTTARATATTRAPNGTAPAAPDRVTVVQMASMREPIAMAVRVGDAAVYVAEKGGRVRRLAVGDHSAAVGSTVLDVTDDLSTGSEQGLLGVTFSPDGSRLYASFTNAGGDTRVVEYPFQNGAAVKSAARVVLAVDQPYANHNGGQITFGPDGKLYIGLGDGGSGGDPQGNGQNLNTLLGKMLRVQVTASGSPAYTVPGDNPFAGQAGKRGEIWHYGLRNPWRWSFDRANGEQWIADVGQNAYEEIDHVGAGAKGVNFGWNKREGKHAYDGGAMPPGGVDPEFEYSHANGNCAVVGGYVYRGSTIRGFGGTYVLTDSCRGELVGTLGGTLHDLGIHIDQPSSFGEDASGELWVLSLAGPVYRLGRAA